MVVDRVGRDLVGAPLPQTEIAALKGDAPALMGYLRRKTYELGPQPLKSLEFGREFEDHHRR